MKQVTFECASWWNCHVTGSHVPSARTWQIFVHLRKTLSSIQWVECARCMLFFLSHSILLMGVRWRSRWGKFRGSKKFVLYLFLSILLKDLISSRCSNTTFWNETNQDQPYDALFTNVREMSSQRGFKYLHQNIRSLRHKVDELRLLVSACPNLHVIALTETWVSSDIGDSDFAIDAFRVFRKERNGNGGDVAIYVKDTVQVV